MKVSHSEKKHISPAPRPLHSPGIPEQGNQPYLRGFIEQFLHFCQVVESDGLGHTEGRVAAQGQGQARAGQARWK